MTADGVWTYTLDNTNCAVQALNVGDTLTDTFTVTTTDGTAQVVTVTIHGSQRRGHHFRHHDRLGDRGRPCQRRHADRDRHAHRHRRRQCAQHLHGGLPPTASDAGYGTFTMTADGVWTYTLDNTNCAVQALNVCDTLTDTFTVTTIDGTAQVVTVTIHGTNDAAIISGTTTGSVIEAGCDTPGTPTATGTLTDTDVDNTPNTFTAVCAPTASDAGYGTFTMTADGVWTYTLDNANCAVQALNAGDTLTDTFKVTTVDGTAQVVTITIHGTNDADHYDFGSLYGDSFHFKDTIFGHEGSDAIDLAEVDFIPASISHLQDAAGEQFLLGQHSTDHASIVPDHAGSGVVTHVQHDLMV